MGESELVVDVMTKARQWSGKGARSQGWVYMLSTDTGLGINTVAGHLLCWHSTAAVFELLAALLLICFLADEPGKAVEDAPTALVGSLVEFWSLAPAVAVGTGG